VYPLLPDQPEWALAFTTELPPLFPPPVFDAEPVAPVGPLAPELPDVAVPSEVAAPVAPVSPVVPDVAVVSFDADESAAPELPPMTLPVTFELPPFPEVTVPVTSAVELPLLPEVAMVDAAPPSPLTELLPLLLPLLPDTLPVSPEVDEPVALPVRPDQALPLLVPVAAPPAPPLPDVIEASVLLLPDVALLVAFGVTVTGPELPLLPESPDVALLFTFAEPESPVLPLLPELPVLAFALMMQL